MIGFLPRRGVAVLAAFAFTVSLGEGLLASVCPPEAEMAAFMEHEEAPDAVASAAADASHAAHHGSHGLTPDATSADHEPHAPHERMACCVGGGGSPAGGSEPIPCPFMPLGSAGSCQAVPFAAPAQIDFSLSFELTRAFQGPFEAHEHLFASPPFQPPRA